MFGRKGGRADRGREKEKSHHQGPEKAPEKGRGNLGGWGLVIAVASGYPGQL